MRSFEIVNQPPGHPVNEDHLIDLDLKDTPPELLGLSKLVAGELVPI